MALSLVRLKVEVEFVVCLSMAYVLLVIKDPCKEEASDNLPEPNISNSTTQQLVDYLTMKPNCDTLVISIIKCGNIL